MATLELITNLKLINGTARTTVPTTEELPLGYMCFGIVNSRASIWGNYDNTVHDLVAEGTVTVDIVQTTGQSTTAVISQKGVTDAINAAKTEVTSNLGTASSKDVGTAEGNVPVLGSGGKLDQNILPSIAITETFVVASESEMLALTAQVGDVAVRTDVNKSFILQNSPATTVTNWVELLAPDCKVLSVNGKVGAVVLAGADINVTFSEHSGAMSNIMTGSNISESFGIIAQWFNNFGRLTWKSYVDVTTDLDGVVPAENLPTATSSTKGIANFGNGLNVTNGSVSVKPGVGITVDANGVSADVVLKITTI